MKTGAVIGDAPGNVPVVLLPVRLETRFVPRSTGGTDLLVRVYPDDLHGHSHDPRLLDAERESAHAYHTALAEDERLAAWTGLARRFGTARSLWIVRATAPDASDPGSRTATWERAVEGACLPDHWVYLGYRAGAPRITVVGSTIAKPLLLGPTPGGDTDGMQWLTDFDAAVAAGMATRIANVSRLDRLIVVGIAAASEGSAGAGELSELLAGHIYSDGLALVAQGAASNNTETRRAGFSADESDPAESYALARTPQTETGDGRDGSRLASVLGVPASTFASVSGAATRESQDAQAMNAALWEATWGHMLATVMQGTFAEPTIEALRRHFIDFVRARGPVAALRVGRQPYGVLPVVPLAAAEPDDEAPIRGLVSILSSLWPLWIHAGAEGQAGTVTDKLAHTAVSRTDSVRAAWTSARFPTGMATFMGIAAADVDYMWRTRLPQQLAKATAAVSAGATPQWPPWVLIPGDRETVKPGWPATLPRLGATTEALEWLATAEVAALKSEVGRPAGSDSLLYLLVRSALLGLAAAGTSVPAPALEQAARGRLDGTQDPPGPGPAQETYAGIGYLKGRPAAIAERALAETVDLASHRLDAWVTSIAARRLGRARAAGGDGIVIGGYGLVEDLFPKPKATVQSPPPRPDPSLPATIPVDPQPGGYLHAPSVPQAVTGAVLRSGRVNHQTEIAHDSSTAPFAIELSSRRVRLAKSLLEGIHQGRRLGALLGYRFERALQERGAHQHIAAFREFAPLDAPELARDARDLAAAATDVVDGLALARRRHEIPWGTRVLRWALPDEADVAVRDALDELEEAVDAVSDSLIAEAVHHTVHGRPGRAGAGLAAAARGDLTVDELEFVRTPRTGTSYTQRLIVTAPAAAPSWPETPRGHAEPALTRWAAAALGAAASAAGAAQLVDAQSDEPLDVPPVRMRLSDLGLGPLDLLAIVDRAGELERVVSWWLVESGNWPADAPADARVRITETSLTAGEVALADVLAVARAAAAVVAVSRPLDGRDVGDRSDDPAVDLAELAVRAEAARDGMVATAAAIRDALDDNGAVHDEAALRRALAEGWSRGIRDALPAAAEALPQQAFATAGECDRRVNALEPISAEAPAPARLRTLLDNLATLFGDGFCATPGVQQADAALLDRAIDGTATAPAPSGHDPLTWFARVARVQRGAAALETLFACRELLTQEPQAKLFIGQLPPPPEKMTRPWIGLPFSASANSAPAGPPQGIHTALTFAGARPELTADGKLAGLVVAEWAETIPSRQETGAVAFRHDSPGAQAPQTILVAVPPVSPPEKWDLAGLEAAVLHAAELVRVRLAQPSSLTAANDWLRWFLPAIYLPGEGAGPNAGGVEVGRLLVPPVGYGVAQLPNPPTITRVSPGELRQNTIARLTVEGSSLENATYRVSGTGVTLTHSGATLTAKVDPDAESGARTLEATTVSGSAQYPLTIVREARIDAVAPTRVAQRVGRPTTVRVAVTGQALPTNATAAVTTAHGGTIPATVEPSLTPEESVVVTLALPAGPTWASDWDPTEPGGPLHPRRRPPVTYTDVELVLTLTGAVEVKTSVLVMAVPSYEDA